MRETMIAVAAAGALGMATMATGTMAFGHGGGGHGAGAGHFASGEAHFGGGHFAGGFQNRHFVRGIRGGIGGLYGFGAASPYYGYDYSSCYVVTPDGYAWVCD
jgi:hypothetical protein